MHQKTSPLDHLNQDEYEHVERLIINSAYRFQIPGEPLEATNVLQHSILQFGLFLKNQTLKVE